ncbi:MAG: sulfite exporter TauE/SafE family protein [Archangium sp.]
MFLFVAATTAAVTGATGSVHCALMCGPLACASMGQHRGASAVIGWQLGRLFSYVLLGAAFGALGRGVSSVFLESVTPVLPWVMAIGLVIASLDVGKRLRALPFARRGASTIVAKANQQQSPLARSFLFGVATPLLPCGLLYGLFLAAMASGGALEGAVLLGAFALGAMPALLGAQLGLAKLNLPPWVRRVVPLAAAAVLIVRALLARGEVAHCG